MWRCLEYYLQGVQQGIFYPTICDRSRYFCDNEVDISVYFMEETKGGTIEENIIYKRGDR